MHSIDHRVYVILRPPGKHGGGGGREEAGVPILQKNQNYSPASKLQVPPNQGYTCSLDPFMTFLVMICVL